MRGGDSLFDASSRRPGTLYIASRLEPESSYVLGCRGLRRRPTASITMHSTENCMIMTLVVSSAGKATPLRVRRRTSRNGPISHNWD